MPTDQTKTDELNRRLDDMVGHAVTDFKRWEPIYRDGLNYVYDDQLANVPVRKDWDRVQTNYIYPAMMQEQAILAQSRTRIICKPVEPSDTEGAELWASILQWVYSKGVDVPNLRHEGVMDGKVYGHWVVKPYWEPEAEWDDAKGEWKGEVRVTLLRPEYIGIDPDAERSDLADAKYAYLMRDMPMAEAIERWPEHKVVIETAAYKTAEVFGMVGGTGRYISAASSKIALDGAAVSGEAGTATVGAENEGRLSAILSKRDKSDADLSEDFDSKQDKAVSILEIYFKDTDTETVKTEEDVPFDDLVVLGVVRLSNDEARQIYVFSETGETVTQGNRPKIRREYQKPKFPNGRKILRINKTILNEDSDEQVWEYRQWPFVVGVNYKLPHTWHGLNGVEMAKSPQDWINTIWSHLANYVKCFSDPVQKVEEGALQNDPNSKDVSNNVRSAAGSIIKLATGGMSKIQREPPPTISTGLLEICNKAEQETRNATGIQEVALGQQMKGEHTLGEVLRAETNSRLRTSLQALFLSDWTVRLMTQLYEICKKNMTADQKVRIIGEGAQAGEAILAAEYIDSRFDIDLEVTTVMPFDVERRKADAQALYGLLGPAYLKQLLEAFEVKNIDEVMAAVQEQMAAQREAETTKQSTGATNA